MTSDLFPMIIGGEKVRSERMLLAKVENGKNMISADSVRFLVLHCSATRCNQDYSVEQLRRDHKVRGTYFVYLPLSYLLKPPLCRLSAIRCIAVHYSLLSEV